MRNAELCALGWGSLVYVLGCAEPLSTGDAAAVGVADAAGYADGQAADALTLVPDGALPDGAGQIVSAGCGRATEAGIFEATFEGGDFSEVHSVHADSGAEVDIVAAPAGNDGRAVRFSITPNQERAELRVYRVAQTNTDYYYDWLVFLPDDWQPAEGKSDIITQWHRGGGIPAWAQGHPMVLALHDDGGYALTYSFLSDPQDVGSRVNQAIELPRNAAGDLGRWVRWGLYARWSVNGDGALRVYHDCELVAEHQGANWLPEVATPMWKAGIYTGDPGWNGPDRYTLYEDDFRVFEE